MNNTKSSFKNKWSKNPTLAFSETLNPKSEICKWILNRNGFKNPSEFKRYLKDKRRILDAGCGNGRVTALLCEYTSPENTEVVGIDFAAAKTARQNLVKYKNIHIYKKNLLEDLSKLGRFDFIYCQEVLHHTKNPAKAFQNLCKLLNNRGGEIAIYVYKKKAPTREFVDDYVRRNISHLSYKEALKVCDQITKFGQVLSECKVSIKIPPVDVLQITGGEYDLQRLIYYFIMKCYWNPELSFHDNSVINYDWYHPQLCSRHTLAEVREWFKQAELEIVHQCVDFFGITLRGKLKK